jgi:hypothetical protein
VVQGVYVMVNFIGWSRNNLATNTVGE